MKRYLSSIPEWVWIAIVAAVLRFVNLGSESVWYDEAFTAWLAKLPLDRLMLAVAGDVHPPTWYLLEWVNIRIFGSSEFALRFPAAILGIVLALLVYRVASKLEDSFPRVALIAGLLAATTPGILYYGQEARMYTLLASAVLLALLGAIERRWFWFTVGCIVAVYAQNLGVFYVFALGSVALAINYRKPLAPLLSLFVVVAAWVPWGLTMIHQAQAINAGFWITPINAGEILFPLPAMTAGLRLAPAFQSNVYAAVFGLSGLSLVVASEHLNKKQLALLLSVLLGGPGVIALISWLWRSVYLFRALIPSAAVLTIFWAVALVAMDKRNRRVALVICAPMFLIALISHYLPGSQGREDWKAWVQPIKAQWLPGDVVFYGSISPAILATYYLPGYEYAMRPHSSDLNQSLSNDTVAAMGFVEQDFDKLKASHKRAWLIVDLNPLSRADEFQEMDRILAHYPNKRMDVYAQSDAVETKLYLVDLK